MSKKACGTSCNKCTGGTCTMDEGHDKGNPYAMHRCSGGHPFSYAAPKLDRPRWPSKE